MQQGSGIQPNRRSGGKRRKTRDLILQAARELFNERGEAHVTLAHIGEHLGISEGNVWYHFHTKRDLILALFVELQEQVKANQEYSLDDLIQLNNLSGLLTRGFSLMWDYRFLLRDYTNWVISEPAVHAQVVALTMRGHDFAVKVLERLLDLRALNIERKEIPTLATNIWIVIRYWIDYCQSRNEQRQITEQDIQEGIEQVRALVRPYLTPAVLDILNLVQDRADVQ
ncbi:MAG: TetR/AcrR family transcriptional regulator [Ktedonobacteraceae bacterium]